MRTRGPLILTTLAGLIVIAAQYFAPLSSIHFDHGFTIISFGGRLLLISEIAAILVGIISLTRLHVTSVVRRRPGYYASVVLLVSMYGYLIYGLIFGLRNVAFHWILVNVLNQLTASVYSMLVFFIFSAAYHAFRVRSWETLVMFVAAFLVMVGQLPASGALIPGWPHLSNWIIGVPTTGAMRGIIIGAAMGGFVVALRILLGLERSYIGGGA